jgi:cobalt-zinc-cadmium efflux system membrane fusion protein
MKHFYISCCTFLILLMSCKDNQSDAAAVTEEPVVNEIKLTPEQSVALKLQLGNPASQEMHTSIKVQGLIDLPPQNMISVNFPMGGFLKQTKLIPGMHIAKGEVIATISDQAIIQLQQDYLLAKAKLDLLRLELSRQQDMKDARAGVSRNFQQTEADVKMQTITMRGMYEKLKLIGIDPVTLNESNLSGEVLLKSPINGYVSKVNVNTGKYIQPTETIFELIDPEDIHVALTIFEKDLASVRKGAMVDVRLPNNPGRSYAAEIILVNKDIEENRTATAHCHFKEHAKDLLPGMLVDAEIAVENKQSTVLPDAALVRYGNQQFVFVMQQQNLVQMLPVKTGISAAGNTEIISGLEKITPGTVVLNNAYKLLGILKNSGEE